VALPTDFVDGAALGDELMPRERLSALPAEYIPMATTVQKFTLSPSRDIPFNKLLLSQSNVRRVEACVSVEELAEDIARRGLLQGLSVRPAPPRPASRPACSRSWPTADVTGRWSCS